MRATGANFKRILRMVKSEENEIRSHSIAEKLHGNISKNFWKSLDLKPKCTKLAKRIDGISGSDHIAQFWREKYSKILNNVDDHREKEELDRALDDMPTEPLPPVTPEEVFSAISDLRSGSSAGLDCTPPEVYKHAPMPIINWLSQIFNSFLMHSYLPPQVTDILLIPLPKNKLGDITNSKNYRPIAIASAGSKILEKILLLRLQRFLYNNDYQFGFKKYHSTDLCIYSLKETINYYRSLNSPVFTCFIDIKSAFDSISYYKLFCKLVKRGVPLMIILFLRKWYETQRLSVGWGSGKSSYFGMTNGIRQGSILSPHLFTFYIHELNVQLSQCGVGCHITGVPMNNFSYADDLALVAPAARAINIMLGICDNFAANNFIKFSTEKSVAMVILPPRNSIASFPDILLSGAKLSYVAQFKYLGYIMNTSFTDDDDIKREMQSLCKRGNMIIRKFAFCTADVKCMLFKAFIYSLYCCPLWSRFNVATLQKLKVCYNKIMRQLLGLPPWHSASSMFANIGVRSFDETLRAISYSTMNRVDCCPNRLLYVLSYSDAYVMSPIQARWQNILFI